MVAVQSSFVADTYRMSVVTLAMRTDFVQRTSAMNFSVACQVEVIADVAEVAVEDVVVAAIFKAQAHALGRGRTMNDDKRDDSHRPMQEVRPNTPASAVATAMIDLRTMPHTDFDFVAIMI
jgi:hypothetical protein